MNAATPLGAFVARQRHGPSPTTAFALAARKPRQAAEELLSLARSEQLLHFDLGTVHEDDRPFFEVIAKERSTNLYGFRLRCDIESGVDAARAGLLRNAGVRQVRLTVAAGPAMREANLRQVRSVMRLHAALIDVRWSLLQTTQDRDQIAALADDISMLTHLPPPDGVQTWGLHTGPAPALAAAVTRWQQDHEAWTLTFSAGPGFVRIRDARRGREHWTFLTLEGLRAEAFLAADDHGHVDAVAAGVPPLAATQARQILDALVARRVVVPVAPDEYLNLVVRRRMEERWTSADN